MQPAPEESPWLVRLLCGQQRDWSPCLDVICWVQVHAGDPFLPGNSDEVAHGHLHTPYLNDGETGAGQNNSVPPPSERGRLPKLGAREHPAQVSGKRGHS